MLLLTHFAAIFHVRAGQCHGRSAQGECFGNMAYAFSQLEDLESARDFYRNAELAAKDTGIEIASHTCII